MIFYMPRVSQGVKQNKVSAHFYCDITGLTISGDGTSNRHRNYESQHIAFDVPTSYTDMTAPTERVVRSVGVHASVNHTSEVQLKGWQDAFEDIIELFNRSPLARRGQLSLNLVLILRKLCGMNSDHAEDQKKLARLVEQWKKATILEDLGSEYLLKCTPDEQARILSTEQERTVLDLGGPDKWSSLSLEARNQVQVSMVRALTARLGETVFNQLSNDEQRDLMLFL